MPFPLIIARRRARGQPGPHFGIDGAWRAAMYLAIVGVVGAIAASRLAQSRQRRQMKAAAAQPLVPEPVGV